MLTVLSPAKRLDFESNVPSLAMTSPALHTQAQGLMKVAKRLSSTDLRSLMGISETLAELNRERFAMMQMSEDAPGARPAAMAFKGDVYLGLDAPSMTDDDLSWAQSRLGILSGLYGILRPLDAIEPYRLEMGTRLKTSRGANLYAYWGERVSAEVLSRLADHAHPVVVNLASNEYFKVLKSKALRERVITPVFKEMHNGKLKIISFNAKRSRGLMARWIIDQRIDDPSLLTSFDQERYTHREDLSEGNQIVFTRDFQPVGG